MRLFSRLVAWSCFLGFLTALGGGVFHFVRYRPRCVIEAKNQNCEVLHLSEDGRRLVTYRSPSNPLEQSKKLKKLANQARLEVVDTTSGKAIYSVENFAAADDSPQVVQSPDHRYFVGNRIEDSLLVDWRRGRCWTIDAGRKVRRDPQTGDVQIEEERKDPLTGESISIVYQHDCRGIPWKFSPKARWLVSNGLVVEVAANRFARSFSSLHGFIRNDSLALVTLGGEKLSLCLWDMNDHRVAWTVPSDLVSTRWCSYLTSDDGRWLVVADTSKEGDAAERPHIHSDRELVFRSAEVWDLSARKRKLHLADEGHRSRYLVLPCDGSRLAVWSKAENGFALSLIDLNAEGDRLTEPLRKPVSINYQHENGRVPDAQWGLFAPGNGLFAFTQFYEGKERQWWAFTICEVSSNQPLWETRDHCSFDFSPKGDWVSCARWLSSTTEKLAARTGEFHGKSLWSQGESQSLDGQLAIGSPEDGGLPEGAFWEWIGEHLPAWCLPSNDSVIVLETATGRERLRVRLDDRHAAQFEAAKAATSELRLSGDGSALMSVYHAVEGSGHAATLIRIWDVHPHRAWYWAVTSSLLTGVALLLLRRWLQTRKSRPQASPLA